MSENPWASISDGNMILEMDKEIIQYHNDFYKDDINHQISTIDYPEPFIGNPGASIYLLLGNPGRHPKTEERSVENIKNAQLDEIIFRNLRHESQHNCLPFYLLDKKFAEHGGHKWWKKTFKNLPRKDKDDYNKIAESFFAVELYGYHSVNCEQRLVTNKEKLPSTQYSFDLVRKAIKDEKLIIVARAVWPWFHNVKELESYHKCHLLASNRGINLSRTTLSPVAYKEVVEKLEEN